jgi:hypothetical protein
MKKIIITTSLFIFCICAYSQDSMNKKMENRTDKMNKKMENPNDPMNKKIHNGADSPRGKIIPENSDVRKHKTLPKTSKKKPVA